MKEKSIYLVERRPTRGLSSPFSPNYFYVHNVGVAAYVIVDMPNKQDKSSKWKWVVGILVIPIVIAGIGWFFQLCPQCSTIKPGIDSLNKKVEDQASQIEELTEEAKRKDSIMRQMNDALYQTLDELKKMNNTRVQQSQNQQNITNQKQTN